MLGNISHSALTETLTRNLGELYLGQARTEKENGHLDVALTLYNQVKDTLKSLGSVKEALRRAQYTHTLADETLRKMMADAYFERGKVLEGLNLFGKARISYIKAEMWGHDEAKQHRAEAVQPPPSGHSAHSNKWASVRTAIFTSMSVQKKSDLVDYLFKKTLLTLNALKVSNKPSLFLVYAHNNADHGKAEAETSKYFIERLSEIEGVKLYSDQAPMGRPYIMSPEDLKKDGKLGDILTNQLCLLPAQVIKDVKPVDKAVVCCSEVLGSYLKWVDYKKFHQELREAYLKDLDAYGKNNEQNDTLAIRKVLMKFSEEQEYKAGFHHVLTEIAFLQIRAEQPKEHGIIPVSLTLNSYEECLGAFIKATVVRIEDIPRLEGQAQKGGEVYQNQSRHLVLFKLIERLLVGNNESKTFLDKFWTGHSNLISLLKNNSKLGEREFTELIDSIFDGIQSAQHSQLAVIMQEQNEQRWVLKADPRTALKEQYFAALKQDQAFNETQQLYVEPRGQADLNGETETFPLLSKVQKFLYDKQVAKQVILLTGDSGAGKTTLNRLLEEQLWNNDEKESDAIPLFISLASIDKPEHDLIAKALRGRGLSEFQIQKLKKEKQKFVFILDGYDEIRQTQNLYVSNSINQSDGWQGQMVISCRSEYLGQDYRRCFQPKPLLQDKDTSFQEIVIEPFSEEERNRYLEKYVEYNGMGGSAPRYKEALDQPHLKNLVSNPFLLRVVLEALPYLENEGKDRSVVQLRLDLYDQFVRSWFERNQQRLSTQDLTGSKKEIFRELCDDGFVQHGIGFVKDLAVHLYVENAGKPIVEYSLFKDEGNWKESFFGREAKQQLLRETWPLSRSGNQYRFIHKSLLEYFVARSLFDSFDACVAPNTRERRGSGASVYSFETQAIVPRRMLRDISLAPKHWVGDLGVVGLLTERVQQESIFKEQLLAIIDRSKIDPGLRQTAANAITILVKAGMQFIGADLKGIQIPGADLSYGLFDSAQLQGADLRKANLRASWLHEANLSEAQMGGVQFGELPYLQVKSRVFSCAYSPDGQTHVVGLESGKISVYMTSNWKKIYTLEGHAGVVWSVVYSPGGAQLASGGQDTTVRVWDVESGTLKQKLEGHTSQVMNVVYSPGGDRLASGSADNTVRVWDVESGELKQKLEGHTGEVMSVVYSPGGAQLASGSTDNTVRVWDVESGALKQKLEEHISGVYSVVYSPGGDRLASGSTDNTVRVWDVESGALKQKLEGHTDGVYSVVYSPGGGQLASGSLDNTVRVWDVESGELKQKLEGHTGEVLSVVYSPGGAELASGSTDNTVRVWDVESGALKQKLEGHTGIVLSVVYSPGGTQLASGGKDGTVRVWDVESGELKQKLEGHTAGVYSVVYSPGGVQLASGSADNTVRVWDVESGALKQNLEGHTGAVVSVVYSPGGDRLASGSTDNTVRVWDVESGELKQKLEGHTGEVMSVVYSPGGAQLTSGSFDNTVRVWDVESGAERQKLEEGHAAQVWSVVYSPGGAQLASGGKDGTVRVWDVESGALKQKLEGHTG
ncbi:NACHT domain-containing protein, partial [Mycoavidus cysteinexigens]|uniref:WD40 domain-containing protein n=1 Tax=Mycoavidus cysteinexigens TaxID=1553431 RepID=UPI0024E08FB5